MNTTVEKNSITLKNSIQKAHSRAQFVGILYLLGTIILAVAAFFPLVTGVPTGELNVKTVWSIFKEIKDIKTSFIPTVLNVGVALLYAILLLTVVINVLNSLSKLSMLFKKRASVGDGYNRNVIAMDKMGAIFSGTLCMMVVITFMIHLMVGSGFTNLFYVALTAGLIIHFWAGLVGGNVSRFTTGEKVIEEKRVVGRIAPFFRNVAQLVFVGLIMYYISSTNIMLNILKLAESGKLKGIFKGPKMDLYLYLGGPLVQYAISIFTIVLLKHATAATEYNFYGREGGGMKNFRVFSFFVFLLAAVMFGVSYYGSVSRADMVPMVGSLYLAIVALAAFIEEVCMRKLPNVKGKVVAEDKKETVAEKVTEEADKETALEENNTENVPVMNNNVPMQFVTKPMVFMQPNGQPVMVMPMVPNFQVMYPQQPPVDENQPEAKTYVTPYVNPYVNPYMNPYMFPYMNPAYNNPYAYNPNQANMGNPYGGYGQEYEEDREQSEVVKADSEEQETLKETEAPVEERLSSKELKRRMKERKANLAADKKAFRAETAMAKKESRFEAEREAVERALAEKWMKKAKEPIVEDDAKTETGIADEKVVTQPETVEKEVKEPVILPVVEKKTEEPAMETYTYQPPVEKEEEKVYPEATDLTEDDLSRPLPPKKWTVKCPDCNTKLTVKEGSYAYRCPECGGVFQLRKTYKSKMKKMMEYQSDPNEADTYNNAAQISDKQ